MQKFKPHYKSTIDPDEFIQSKAKFLPLGKCYINDDYNETGTAEIVVERIHPGREITVGIFIVDLLCEGIIDAFYLFKQNKFKLAAAFKSSGMDDLIECSYALAHNIIYGASNYASSIGLFNCGDFDLIKQILKDQNADIEAIEIEFGQGNKPLVVVFEDQPKDEVISKLKKTIGAENFAVMDAGGNLIDISDQENKQLITLLAANYEVLGFNNDKEIIARVSEVLPADDAIPILLAISSFEDGSSYATALGEDVPATVQARIIEFLYLSKLEEISDNQSDITSDLFARVLSKQKYISIFDIPNGLVSPKKTKTTHPFEGKSSSEIIEMFTNATSYKNFFGEAERISEQSVEEIYSEAIEYHIQMGNIEKAQQYFDALDKLNLNFKILNHLFSLLIDEKANFISL